MKFELILFVCFVVVFVEINAVATRGGRDRERPWRRQRQNATATPSNCPALECPGTHGVCPYGKRHDEHHCQLCECRPSPRCRSTGPQISCSMHCEQGFQIGQDGCPTCTCYNPLTASQLPAAPAADGVVVAAAAGDQVQQLPADVPPRTRPGPRRPGGGASVGHHSAGASVTSEESSSPRLCATCMKFCSAGFRMGSDGCPLCECNDDPPTGTDAPGRPRGGRGRNGRPGRRHGLQCYRPTCAMYCENGFRRDQNGCTLCECQQSGDTPLQMPTDSSVQCRTLQCHSRKNCAFGFAVDSTTNCPSCACRPDAGS